jgi:hypothetical protein
MHLFAALHDVNYGSVIMKLYKSSSFTGNLDLRYTYFYYVTMLSAGGIRKQISI